MVPFKVNEFSHPDRSTLCFKNLIFPWASPSFSRGIGGFPGGKQISISSALIFFLHFLFVSVMATELDTQSLLNDNVVTRTCDAVEYPVKHAQNTGSTYQ